MNDLRGISEMFVPPKAEFCISNDKNKDYFPDSSGLKLSGRVRRRELFLPNLEHLQFYQGQGKDND